MQNTERQDIYTRITAKIVASLETGRPPLDQTVERRERRRADHAPACATTACPTPASTS